MTGRWAILALIVAVYGCGPKEPASLDIVRVSERGFITSSGLVIAYEEGYFRDEGIEVVFEAAGRSSSQLIPLLERGDIDVLQSAVSASLVAAVIQGGRLRMVADMGHASPEACDHVGIVGHRDAFSSDSPTTAEVKGKRFSINPPGANGYAASRFLAARGLSLSDIRTVRLMETVEAQALEAGTLEGVNAQEPFLSRLLAQGHRLIGPANKYTPGDHYAVVVFGPSLTVDNRDLGTRFMKAYLRGVAQFMEGATDRNVELIARRRPFEPGVLKAICMPVVRTDGVIREESIGAFIDYVFANGLIDSAIEPARVIDMGFARDAARQLGVVSAND